MQIKFLISGTVSPFQLFPLNSSISLALFFVQKDKLILLKKYITQSLPHLFLMQHYRKISCGYQSAHSKNLQVQYPQVRKPNVLWHMSDHHSQPGIFALCGPTYILHAYPIQDIGTSCFRKYQYLLTSFMKSKGKRVSSCCLPVLMDSLQKSQARLPEKLLQKSWPRKLTREIDNVITAPRDVCPGQKNKLCEIKNSTCRLLVPSTIEKNCKVVKGPFNI